MSDERFQSHLFGLVARRPLVLLHSFVRGVTRSARQIDRRHKDASRRRRDRAPTLLAELPELHCALNSPRIRGEGSSPFGRPELLLRCRERDYRVCSPLSPACHSHSPVQPFILSLFRPLVAVVAASQGAGRLTVGAGGGTDEWTLQHWT